ncbi:MAG: DUF1501 domain-containing protein [Blastocatellia bacterium]
MEESAKHQQEKDPAFDFEAIGMRNPFLSEYSVFYLTLLYFLALAPFTPGFATAENIGNIFSNMLPLLVVAIGQTLVLITGGIDLSVTSTIALSSVTGAMVMSADHGLLRGNSLAAPCGILAMLLVGAAIGALNGLAITRLGMPGILSDLKSRGLLEDTLVVWTTEYGRTPWVDQPDGRGHHNFVFSSWMAGGGVKPGIVYGQSDEYGDQVAENEVHVHDFHATILHLLGFDHTRLTYRYAGRDFRLTDVHGNVVKGILA